jgi:SagB-type dehydrogenase family enzyme
MTSPSVTGHINETVRLRPGVFRALDAAGREYLLHRNGSELLGRLTGPQRDILHQLAESDCDTASLRTQAQTRGPDAVAELDSLLAQLRAGGWLRVTVGAQRSAYTLLPRRFPPAQPAVFTEMLVLSRFAVLRRDREDLVIESARSWCDVAIHAPDVAAALVSCIAPSAAPLAMVPEALAARLKSDLLQAALLVPVNGDEDTGFAFRQWSPHELWFHDRSRGDGTTGGHFGRTSWAAGQYEPLPGRRPAFPGPAVELVPPDLAAVQRTDVTLTEALEQRRSIRRHDDDHPISVGQLAEFLYRSAGVRAVVARDGVDHVTGPNPSGGALDPLEFYVIVRLVDGLAAGAYRYDRFDHRLERVSAANPAVARLLDTAQAATSGGSAEQTYPPQVLLCVAARFGRVGWSYETMAYSLILRQVGVAYQTMYCVATAMGLAPCALGAGDPLAFAAATGLDPLQEAAIGEFILGSRPAGAASPRAA